MKRVTNQQVKALEYFVTQSQNAKESCKRAVLLLIKESDNLTKSVHLVINLNGKKKKFVKDILYGVHDMCSGQGSTHLDSFCEGMGTKMRFNSWSTSPGKGFVAITTGLLNNADNSKRITFNLRRINAIKLPT